MTSRRTRAVRLLLLIALLLTCVQYAVATLGVQLFTMPVRTDFASYYLAGQLTAQHANPYDAAALAAAGHATLHFDYEQYPFLYPPAFALAMQPLSQLPFEPARQCWMLLSTACLIVALIVTHSCVRFLARQLHIQQPLFLYVVFVPFVIMVLHSTAVHNDLRSGSVGSMLWMTLVLVLYSAQRRRPLSAGLWLGLASCIKLVPLVLLPWVVWRCGRRAAAAAIATLALSLGAAMLHWGAWIVPAYLEDALWPAAHLQHAWPHNVSLDAFWLRLQGPLQGSLPVGSLDAAGILALCSWLSVLGILLVTLQTFWRQRHATASVTASVPLELAVATLGLLLIMRITWVHSLTAMLFVLPIILCGCALGLQQQQRWAVPTILLGCLGFFLAAAHLPFLWGERWQTWPWLLAPGLHTVGLLVLWGVGVFLLRQQQAPQRQPTSPRVT